MKLNAMEFVDALNAQLAPGQKRIMLSEDQAKVVEASSAPTLVVAGAGSGKTEVMSLRALYLVYRDELEPDSILGLTFTRKATANFTERLSRQLELMRRASLLGKSDTIGLEPTVATYNSFAQNIVREYGLHVGVNPSAALISEAHAWQVIDGFLDRYTDELPDLSRVTIRDAVLAMSQHLVDHQLSTQTAVRYLQEVAEHIENPIPTYYPSGKVRKKALPPVVKSFGTRMRARALLMPLVEQYWAYKRENDLIDFTDQLALARRIIDACPEVGLEIRGQYGAILLDEFQDTSVGQLQLFSTLFHDTAATAVGDPNQAIYGWRGASAASLSMFHSYFDPKGRGSTLQLRDAWRNWSAILEAANVVAKPDSKEVHAREEYNSGETAPSIEIDKLRANPAHSGRGLVKYLFPSTRSEENELVARLIRNWQTNVKTGERVPSIAVLARKRRLLEPQFDALKKMGVNARMVGFGGLFTEPAITDIVSVMRVLTNADGAAMMRMLTNLDLSARDIALLWDWARFIGHRRVERALESEPFDSADPNSLHAEFLLDAVLNPPEVGWKRSGKFGFSEEARRRVLQLARRLNTVSEHMDRSVTSLIVKIVRVFDLDLDIRSDPFDNQGEVAIDAFVEFAASYEAETPYASVRNFLEWIDATLESEERHEVAASDPGEGVVLLMTIHQAKGLEWDKVVVIGLNEGDMPGVATINPKDAAECTSLGAGLPGVKPIGGWTSDLKELPYNLRLDREYEGGVILPIFPDLAGADVAEVDEIFKTYRTQLSLHELQEARRLAYVAWTRASNELVLSGAWYDWDRVLMPSRYLQQMLQGESVEQPGVALAQPIGVDEVTVPGYPTPPKPVVLEFEDAIPEEVNAVAPTIPRLPGPSRTRMSAAAQDVNSALGSVRRDLHAGRTIEDLLNEMLKAANAAPKEQIEEQSALIYAVRDAIDHELRPVNTETEVEIERLSAVQAERLLSDPHEFARSLRRPVPNEPSRAAQIGTVFHRWAEQWLGKAAQFDEGVEPEVNLAATEIEAAGDAGDSLELVGEARERLLKLQARAIDVLGEHPEGVQAVEEDFSYNRDGLTVRGRYDALLKVNGRWTVLDWKTGAPPRKGLVSRFLRGYATQLEIYRRALAAREGIAPEDVDAVLVFLGGGDHPAEQRTVRLDNLHALLDDYDFERDWKQVIQTLG